jgi:hypothetical protein
MPRSMHALAIVAFATACAQTSQPSTTTAPVVSASASAAGSQAAEPPITASAPPSAAAEVPSAEAATGADARFRACQTDADCIAVPRAGCCRNGWKEAVAVTQQDAYAQANACTRTPRPICPMYIARDSRVARCDPQAHLCTMVRP